MHRDLYISDWFWDYYSYKVKTDDRLEADEFMASRHTITIWVLTKKMLGIKIAFVGDRMKVFLFLPY